MTHNEKVHTMCSLAADGLRLASSAQFKPEPHTRAEILLLETIDQMAQIITILGKYILSTKMEKDRSGPA